MSFKLFNKSGKFNNLLLVLVTIPFIFSSCLHSKEINYFQVKSDQKPAADSIQINDVFEPIIQTNDILRIQVASINIEAAKFFNPAQDQTGSDDENNLTHYLVDLNGDIEIPLIGKLKVAGLTTRQIRDTLRIKLEKYLESPTVRVHFSSYTVSVLGEVKMPGQYKAASEKFTITDALGFAGDLTIFGDRKNVILIRENNGKKEFNYIDLTTRDVFKTNLFYLHPGDVVYVPPGKGRIAAADSFYRIAPLVLSTMTLLLLVANLFLLN